MIKDEYEVEETGIDAIDDKPVKPKKGRRKPPEKFSPEEMSMHGKPMSLAQLGFVKGGPDGSFTKDQNGITYLLYFMPNLQWKMVVGESLEMNFKNLLEVADTLEKANQLST
jgi:hypothetical protein